MRRTENRERRLVGGSREGESKKEKNKEGDLTLRVDRCEEGGVGGGTVR